MAKQTLEDILLEIRSLQGTKYPVVLEWSGPKQRWLCFGKRVMSYGDTPLDAAIKCRDAMKEAKRADMPLTPGHWKAMQNNDYFSQEWVKGDE